VLIMAFVSGGFRLIPGPLEVTFLDVNQGDCIFIQTPQGKTILTDGGGNTEGTNGFNKGKNIVIPFLLDKGVLKPDVIMLTHSHSDHIQGVIEVVKTLGAGQILAGPQPVLTPEYQELIKICAQKNIPVHQVKRDDVVQVGSEVKIEVLHPGEDLIQDDKDGLNNNSVAARLVYGSARILLGADVEKQGEEDILQTDTILASQVLKVPHHGSSFSSTPGFLDKVNPAVGVISVGKNNFGHPGESTIQRLDQRGIKVYRTDRNGAVIVRITKRGMIKIRSMM